MDYLHNLWTRFQEPEVIPEYRRWMMQHITEVLTYNPDYTLLDCGCGTGLIYEQLPKEHKPRYAGFDFTQDAVDFCRDKHPEATFYRANLLDPESFTGVDLMVTQNVIQHILLWQEAIRNIYSKKPKVILMCERTQLKPTDIAGYSPAVRWRFNIDDYRKVLEFYGGDEYTPVEILGHPKSTKNELNMLTIYRTRRK